MIGVADAGAVRDIFRAAWKPPRVLKLSEWADEYYRLSVETSPDGGRWKTLPYQREILDAFSDQEIEQVSVMKSARVGWTLCAGAVIAYHMVQDPCPQMLVQPTIEDAKGYSKENIGPMLRDVPCLAGLITDSGPKSGDDTLLQKMYAGGTLTLVGANSARGFRRVSRRVVLFDEPDGYPPTAGNEGDQIQLGIRRTEYYWNRKIGAGSTPTIAGISRIEALFNAGDQRRFHVPCVHCGRFDFLTFRKGADDSPGHWMEWPKGKPGLAHFICRKCGCEIDHKHKRDMVENGKWVPGNPGARTANGRIHASFHIWAAYSYSPNASWGQIAQEFDDAKGKPEVLKTFINTVLGETWKDRGEAPDWERLFARRRPYQIGTVPAGVKFLTCGIDVQKDYWRYEVVGWGEDKQSWSIDAGDIYGDTANEAKWALLDPLVDRVYPSEHGPMPISRTAVDTGYNTQQAYNWARRYPLSKVIAIKGMPGAGARSIIGAASPVDVTVRGRRLARGYRIFPVGGDMAKSEFYGWLRLPLPADGQPYPPGFCHFPEYDQDYFQQITAEHLVTTVIERTGFSKREWMLLPNRKNHGLDARLYARAAAALCGLDRWVARAPPPLPASVVPADEAPPAPSPVPQAAAPVPQAQQTAQPKRGGWLSGGASGARGRGGYWGRKR